MRDRFKKRAKKNRIFFAAVNTWTKFDKSDQKVTPKSAGSNNSVTNCFSTTFFTLLYFLKRVPSTISLNLDTFLQRLLHVCHYFRTFARERLSVAFHYNPFLQFLPATSAACFSSAGQDCPKVGLNTEHLQRCNASCNVFLKRFSRKN